MAGINNFFNRENVAVLARHVGTAVGTALIGSGMIDASFADAIVGAFVMLTTVVFGLVESRWKRRIEATVKSLADASPNIPVSSDQSVATIVETVEKLNGKNV